jgi:hypothetical protein
MKAIVGVFKSRSDAERGAAELVPLEIPKDRINSTGDAKVRLANTSNYVYPSWKGELPRSQRTRMNS